jgi:hypothetical protein
MLFRETVLFIVRTINNTYIHSVSRMQSFGMAKAGGMSTNQSQSQSQSQSHVATDGQSLSKSWCRAPSGAHGQILFTI